MILVTVPVRTVSEMNVHTHWTVRASRAKSHRALARITLQQAKRERALPAVVTLCRIAPRPLDDDNLRGALKAVRDGVADWLGVDDRDPRVQWAYEQRRGAPKAYSVEVAVAPRCNDPRDDSTTPPQRELAP